MEKAASELMGEPVLQGATIASRGHISKLALGGIGGAVGAVVVGAIASARKQPSVPGNHKGFIYLAIGPTKLALFAVKQGWLSNSIDKLLAEHLRSDVAAMEVKGGMIPSINILLADGTDYSLECALMFLGKAKKVKEILGK
jgi:hypothetical protein